MEIQNGTILGGHFRITAHIASGGMADVYKAVDTQNDMVVAIKVLKNDSIVSGGDMTAVFENEFNAAKDLKHKNIVRVYEEGEDSGYKFIVMEYVDGITLREYIDQQGVLTWREAAHFTTQILKGLQYAHGKGVVHRDVKPENIMLREDGSVKITDFGIASIDSRKPRITETHSKSVGSVHYIAPEQVRNGQTDERTDIYSVGVMLYEMLTGQPPFDAERTEAVAVMHLQADPTLPSLINQSIPEGLEEITMQAMQKEPSDRYQQAEDMLMDLDAFKRNPNIHFDYRYMTDTTPTRYINAVNQARREQELRNARREKSPVIPVLTGIAFAFVIVAAVMVLLVMDQSGLFASNESGDIEMPKFVGMSYDEVQKYNATHDSKFQFFVDYAFSNEVQQGIVMLQSPKPMQHVFMNSDVNLTISLGVERLLVPAYDGMKYDDYAKECMDKKLVVKKTLIYCALEPGLVYKTNPQPYSDINEGDTVEVFVSQGEKPQVLLMPNCQNLTEEEAKSKLAAMGITSVITNEVDSEKPAGTILSQDPVEGTEISEELTTVSFTISNGKAPTREVAVSVKMPEGLYSNALRVEMYMDDDPTPIYSDTINTNETTSVDVKITGAGANRKINVYLAGSHYQTIGINFTTGEIKSTTQDPEYVVPNVEPTQPVDQVPADLPVDTEPVDAVPAE